MKAYLYGNKAYPEKKPDEGAYTHYCDQGNYKKDLKKWSASGKIVENIEHIEQYENPMTKKTYPKDVIIINGDYFGSYPGQQVEIEITENGCIVIKII